MGVKDVVKALLQWTLLTIIRLVFIVLGLVVVAIAIPFRVEGVSGSDGRRIVILGDSKFELDIQTTFIQYWLASIGLECRISDPIPLDTNYLDFVGFRVNHHKTLLRKGLADNFKSSVRARNLPSIPSYYGWCKEAGALNLFHKHVGAFP